MQGDPTDHLDVEVAQADRPFGGFPDYRECFGQDFLEGILVCPELLLLFQTFYIPNGFSDPRSEFIRFGAQVPHHLMPRIAVPAS